MQGDSQDRAVIRILICEGEPASAEDLAETLRELGYEPAGIATTGEDAVEAADRLRPALILMDIDLAGEIEGISAAALINTRFDIPFVYISRSAEKSDIERAKTTEFYGILTKPVRAQDLRGVVETALCRHAADKRVRESEERYRRMVETACEGVWAMDALFRTTFVNRRMAEMLGYSIEEMLGRRVDSFMPAEDLDDHRATMDIRGRCENQVYERRIRRKDGGIISTLVSATPLTDSQGNFAGSFAMVTDMTETVATIQALSESESRHRQMFERNHAVKLLIDPGTGFIVDANKAACEFYGYSRARLKEMRITDINTLPPEEVFAEMARARSERRNHFFFRHKIASGAVRDVEVHSAPVDVKGRELLYSIVHDITERKEAEEALRISEERLRLATEATRDGIWDWDMTSDNVFRSPFFFGMLGYEPGDFNGRSGEWLHMVHPEDLHSIKKVLADYLSGARESHETAFRMFTKSGEPAWILSRGRVVARDRDGKPSRIVGVHSDITAQKNAEEESARSYELLKGVLESVPDRLIVIDRDFRIQYTNFKNLEGPDAADSDIGGTCYHRIKRCDTPCPECPVLSVFDTGRSVEKEMVEPADGCITEVRAFPILNGEGQVRAVVKYIRDITERKRAEEALRSSEEKFRLTFDASPDAIAITREQDGTFLDVSRGFVEMSGYTRDQILSRTSLEINVWSDPESRKHILENLRTTNHVVNFEAKFKRKDGADFSGLMSAVRLTLDGEPCVLSITRNVEEMKRAEETLRVLAESGVSSEENIFRFLVRQLALSQRIRYAVLACIEPHDPHHARTVAAWNGNDFAENFSYALEGTPCREVIENGSSFHARDVRKFFPDDQIFAEISAESYWGVQLRGSDGNCMGILAVIDDRHMVKRPQTLALLESFAARAVAEFERQGAEEKFRTLFREMLNGFALHEILLDDRGIPANYRFLNVNPAFEVLTGLKAEDIVGKTVLEVMPNTESHWIETYGRVALTGEPAFFENYSRELDKHFEVTAFRPAPNQFACIFVDTTDRKQTEDALRESRERYRSIFENAPVGIFHSTLGGKFVEVNPQLAHTLGYESPQELISHVNKSSISQAVYVDSQRRPDLIKRIIDYGAQWGETENHYYRKNGDIMIGRLIFRRIPGHEGFLEGFVEDITDRKRAETTLRRQRDTLDAVFETAPFIMMLVNQEGRVANINGAGVRFSGRPKGELLGLLGGQLFQCVNSLEAPGCGKSAPCFDCPVRTKVMKTFETGESILNSESSLSVLIGSKPTVFHLLVSTALVKVENTDMVLVTVADVTEKKLAGEEKENLRAQLFEAQKMESIGTLAGGIAHDFNNILQVVLGYSDMLLFNRSPADPAYEGLHAIRKAGRDGSDLAKNLLAFSRRLKPNARPMNLNNEIIRVRRMLERTMPRMIKIEIVLADDLATINADPGQMEQILLNLAVNAQHAMPEGGRLTVETTNVILDEEYCRTQVDSEPGKYVLLTVSDTGQGMEKEVVDRIFEPFFTTKKPGEGTGLGLAMVFGIVKNHKGNVTCDSQLGVGSVFKIYLPAVVTKIEPDVGETRQMPAFGTETILLVDDDAAIRKLGDQILKMSGYSVMSAADGREACALYRAHRKEIALVLLDLIMPEMGGKQCLEELLAGDPDVKVIIASGYAIDGPTKEALEAGAKGFISKPYDTKELLTKIRNVLDAG